jgi:hypothetical protein
LPSPITIEPTNNWSAEDESTWDKRLTKEGSKKILTALKRYEIRWWLKNPDIASFGETKIERRHQSNMKLESKKYELQDSQVYRQEYHDTRLGEIIPATYAICYNDAFEILTIIYEKLIYAGKLITPPFPSILPIFLGLD